MQTVDAERSAGRPVVAGPSLAVDLSWATLAARKMPLRASHPVLASTYADDPEIETLLEDLWRRHGIAADDAVCLTELIVLVHLGGGLETRSFDEVVVRLERGLAAVPDPDGLLLLSEEPAVRLAIRRRIAALSDPAVRGAYVATLERLWRPIDPWWQQVGVRLVEATADILRRQVHAGRPWADIVDPGRVSCCWTATPSIEERLADGQRLMIAPCALFGRGLYIDLPDYSLVGVSAGGGDATARQEAARVARRLRALADPTRLSILRVLAAGPRSVGDIADTFSLKQPTVSAHVKQLREAGLVTSERRGARVLIGLDQSAVDELTAELGTLLSPASHQPA
jgi:ArsR family transcriptional regulator